MRDARARCAGGECGKGSREETSGERRGDGREGGREVRGGRGLSLLDVKSLRRKDGGDVHCSTCAGNRQCQQQHGDEGDKR